MTEYLMLGLEIEGQQSVFDLAASPSCPYSPSDASLLPIYWPKGRPPQKN
jgi:hypothetical protein